MFDESGVVVGGEIVHQHEGQQQALVEMPLQVLAADLRINAEHVVHTMKVTLHHGVARNLLELAGGDEAPVSALAVGIANPDELRPEFAAQLDQIEGDRKARQVADEQSAFTIIDVAAGAGHQHPPLILHALHVVVCVRPEQLLVGEPAGQSEQQGRDREIEQDQARVVTLVGFDQAAGTLRIALFHADNRHLIPG